MVKCDGKLKCVANRWLVWSFLVGSSSRDPSVHPVHGVVMTVVLSLRCFGPVPVDHLFEVVHRLGLPFSKVTGSFQVWPANINIIFLPLTVFLDQAIKTPYTVTLLHCSSGSNLNWASRTYLRAPAHIATHRKGLSRVELVTIPGGVHWRIDNDARAPVVSAPTRTGDLLVFVAR